MAKGELAMIESLEKLTQSLDATNVLSVDYKRTILGYVHEIAREAYENGRKVERMSAERQAS